MLRGDGGELARSPLCLLQVRAVCFLFGRVPRDVVTCLQPRLAAHSCALLLCFSGSFL